MLLTETVIVRRQGADTGFDEYGNPVHGPATDSPSAAWVEPITSREAADRQIQQTYGYVVYLPLTTSLSGADRIVYQGAEFDVIGEPQVQPSGFVVDGFQRVLAQRTTG